MSNIIPLLTVIILIGVVPSGLLTKILYEFLTFHMRDAGTSRGAFNHPITTIFGGKNHEDPLHVFSSDI